MSANSAATENQKQEIRATAGLDWDKLKQAWDASSQYGGSFLVIRHGWIAGEWGTSTSATPIASCTKTLAALAMQRVFDMSATGALATVIGPDDLAYQFLPASWGSQPIRRTISIRHILTMSSGLEPDDTPPAPSNDTTAYQAKLLDPPVRTTPGAEWSYASLPVDTLSLLAEQVTGSKLGDFFNQQIGGPIGVKSLQWAALGTHTYASAYARATARDLARIAYLMLQRGTWNGEQIVSAGRIDEMTRWDPVLAGAVYGPQIIFPTDVETHLRYGHMVWTNQNESPHVGEGVPADAYYFAGFRTKFVMIIPSLDLIIVRIQDGPGAWSDALFTDITTKVIQGVVTTGANSPPTVEVTAPADGTEFSAPASITVVVNAGDPDGSVAQVTFLANGNVIGSSTSAPYELTWQDVPAGGYSLAARATDDAGASTVSAAVDVSVAGSFSVVPDALVFGNQPLNVTSASRDLAIQNTGGADLPISAIGVSGPHASQFSLTNACASSLPPAGICAIGVRFTPTSTGDKTATLSVEAGGAGEIAAVSLDGTGTSTSAESSVSPTSLAFGNVSRGTTSTRPVTIRNTGSVDMPITGFSLSGKNSGQFRFVHDCGASVAAGGSCTVNVSFSPTAKGKKTARLSLDFGGGAASWTVTLKGTGT